MQIPLCQFRSRNGNEGDAEKTPQLVGPRTSSNLQGKNKRKFKNKLDFYFKKLFIRLCAHPGQRFLGIQEGELVPLEALHVLQHQAEEFSAAEAELVQQRADHILHRGGGIVLEGLGLPVLEEHLQHIGHRGNTDVAEGEGRGLIETNIKEHK